MLGDAVVVWELLDSVFKAADPTKPEEGNSSRRQEFQGMIASAHQSLYDHITELTSIASFVVSDALHQSRDPDWADLDNGPVAKAVSFFVEHVIVESFRNKGIEISAQDPTVSEMATDTVLLSEKLPFFL